MCGFCNVWVFVCVGFVMCECVYVCVFSKYVYLLFAVFFLLIHLYVFIFFMLLFNFVSYVFLFLYSCVLIIMYALFCILCLHRANFHSSASLTEDFPCFFLSCKANGRVKLRRRSTARTLLKLFFFCVLFVCKSVLYCLCANVYCIVCVQMCTVLFVCNCVLYFLCANVYCIVCVQVCTVLFVCNCVLYCL